MCLYYFPEQTLGLIKEYLSDKSRKTDATGFYINWLRKRCSVYGFIFGGRWYDIGDQKFYDKAKETFAK
jgi:NDP-sugar pyrophosphorylase family protein